MIIQIYFYYIRWLIILDIEKFCKFLFFSLSIAFDVVVWAYPGISAHARDLKNISWDSSAKISDWLKVKLPVIGGQRKWIIFCARI